MQATLEQPGNEAIKAIFDRNGVPQFVFDHVRYHDSAARLMKGKYAWFKRVETPSWSPDFNKPVEHAHGTVKKEFKTELRAVEGKMPMDTCRRLLVRLAEQHITVDSVGKDVQGLPLMWQVIAATTDKEVVSPKGKVYKGVWGNWPPHELR